MFVNGQLAAETEPRGQFQYRFPEPGDYRLTVLDEQARYDSVGVRVIP